MANPQPPRSLTQAMLVRTIAIVLLALIILVGLSVLIIWLAVRPKRLVYTVEEGSIHGFNLTQNNHLNATFNFVIRAYNPNTKISIYYDKVEAYVFYYDETVAFTTVDPFFQPRRNVTHLGLNLMARDAALEGAAAKDLRLKKSSGEVELDIRVKAKIRFKVGVWKSRHRTLRILCSPTMVHFSSSKGFKRTYCDVDL
ncbi:Late embryogenesis abundant protein, LEA-14 protein [Actinidia chinensis var. chinensis]|uniref:Late embryogenesis abundant protein, LEA-14 protein n=1 Tax=Actinidia chinensis var. chinensis TaxID=1590841 RepID=A0A2R6PEU3_ACTCC|nr:Late embryogenesis abundant protein, LEA-14 protein [Actinidia chinensis var. chinensis]